MNPQLTSYLSFVSEEGIEIPRFVENGSRLLGPADTRELVLGMAGLREKLTTMREAHPRLAAQLGFLADFYLSDPAPPAHPVWKETAFALFYAAQDMDLMPDDTPGFGYLDDAAVAQVVLDRHAEIFAQHCAKHALDWTALQPPPRHPGA